MSFAKRFLGNIGTILEFMTRSETLTEKKLKQMSLPEDFHANRSRLLEKEKEPMTIDTSGMKLLELLPKQNQDGLLEKMLKALLTSPKVKSCSRYKKIWKAKASKSNVLLFQLAVSVLGIKEKEFGLLPTPRASAAMNENLETVKKRVERRGKLGAKLEETIALMYPTPTSRDWKDMAYNPITNNNNRKLLPQVALKNNKPGGKLNPNFVEFLMAYPTNWTKIEQTELKHSGTQSFLKSSTKSEKQLRKPKTIFTNQKEIDRAIKAAANQAELFKQKK